MSLKILVSFNLPDQYMEEIRGISSRFKINRKWNDSDLVDAMRDSEIVFAGKMSREMMKASKNLKWIHSVGAGVDRFLSIPEIVKGSVILTNSRGIHPLQISEHVMALILAFTRKLKEFILSQKERDWNRTKLMPLNELNGKTIGIIGLGTIGNEIAKKTKCFGMKVLATKRRIIAKPATVDELIPLNNLAKLLERSDFVVISAPLTPETEGMIGAKELDAMKRTAYLINIGRGKIIQQEELIRALKEKKIAGAGLDVFEVEPLPLYSELWNMKNVIISPHVAGSSTHYYERSTKIFCQNLRRYIDNEEMINIIDKVAGY